MRYVRFLLLVACLLPTSTAAQHQHAQHKPPAEAGKHADHSFADVERYRSIFESSERDAWQKPDELIRALGLQPGMMVADIGAGTGYFARRFAVNVGREGVVFASDLEPRMVVELRDRADSDGLVNLIPILSSADDPRLPDGLSDIIFICDTWHHISNRVEYARRLKSDLAPGGRVVIVDFRKGELPVGPPPEAK
ncbi:MAG: methyltransferase domain-containing protein, partial [Acidobacteria bacterium]|nr:methyltransferase domain-containing protein [Acidobacteriota bacterium]